MPERRVSWPAWLLAALCVAGTAPVLRSLIVPDLNWCYPYTTSDSYDWIQNGLFWAGEPVDASMRPPGFALLIAALYRLGALSFLPIVNFLFLGFSTVSLFLLLRERHDAWIAAVASWFFFANDEAQDVARYVMGETHGTPFLIVAALAFVRAERNPRAYVAMGAALGVGFLFSYAALPVAAGLGLALLFVRPSDLRTRPLWAGVLAGVLPSVGWIAVRAWHYHTHPDGGRHGVEALLHPSLSNLPFYAIATLALLGLLVLPLYGTGAFRFLTPNPALRRYRAAVLGSLIVPATFWFLLYDWADKRFLVYLLPFFVCLLAEGLEALRDLSRSGRLAGVAACLYLAAALLWNQIRYPSYGFFYLALTPKHFLEAALTMTPAQKAELHLTGARVVRVHERLAGAFSRSLFDPRRVSYPCATNDPSYTCLRELRVRADALLPPGAHIGLVPPAGWPADFYLQKNRIGNALRRTAVLPGEAAVALVGREQTGYGAPIEACGPYALVRTR